MQNGEGQMMKKRESILSKRILAGLLAGVLLGSAFYARPAVAGEVINVVTQEDYEKVKGSNGDVKPQQSLTDNSVTIGVAGGGNSPSIGSGGNKDVYGGYTAGTENAKNNKVFVKSGEMRYAIGGYSYDGKATENKVYISGGTMSNVYGGYSDNGAVTDNTVNISGGTIEYSVYGGNSNKGAATGNNVYISGGTMRDVYGGNSYYGKVTGNNVIISDGRIKSSVYGGYSENGDATGNSVYISGGTINGTVNGGYSINGAVTGNTVTVSGTPIFGENTVLYGGFSINGGTVSGNTLNFNSKERTVKQVQNFENYNFCLPGGTRAGNILLTMTADNGADISGSKVQVSAEGTAAAFKAGDQITLLYTDTPGTGSVIKADNMDYGKEMRQGVSVVYDITTGLNEDGHKLVTTIDGGKTTEQSKSPVETQAATAAFLNSGADLLVGGGIASMTAVTTADDGAIFGAMGGGSMRYKTGSYADVKGYNLALGFGKAVNNNAGRLTFGPFIEYGKGEYTSHLDGGIRGDGNAKYYGVGVLARQDNNDGVYYEGSLRYGRMDADYASGDLIGAGGSKVYSSYDSSSAYYGAHLGIGKVTELNDTTKADVYAKFMYTHQNGDSVALRGEGAGEVYDFDAVDSTRARIGARVSRDYSARGTGYAGLAYEYEFDGEAKATVLGFSTPSPSIKGSSGLLELGYILQPKGANDPAIDINLQGWGGKKQGFTGNVNFVWKF